MVGMQENAVPFDRVPAVTIVSSDIRPNYPAVFWVQSRYRRVLPE